MKWNAIATASESWQPQQKAVVSSQQMKILPKHLKNKKNVRTLWLSACFVEKACEKFNFVSVFIPSLHFCMEVSKNGWMPSKALNPANFNDLTTWTEILLCCARDIFLANVAPQTEVCAFVPCTTFADCGQTQKLRAKHEQPGCRRDSPFFSFWQSTWHVNWNHWSLLLQETTSISEHQHWKRSQICLPESIDRLLLRLMHTNGLMELTSIELMDIACSIENLYDTCVSLMCVTCVECMGCKNTLVWKDIADNTPLSLSCWQWSEWEVMCVWMGKCGLWFKMKIWACSCLGKWHGDTWGVFSPCWRGHLSSVCHGRPCQDRWSSCGGMRGGRLRRRMSACINVGFHCQSGQDGVGWQFPILIIQVRDLADALQVWNHAGSFGHIEHGKWAELIHPHVATPLNHFAEETHDVIKMQNEAEVKIAGACNPIDVEVPSLEVSWTIVVDRVREESDCGWLVIPCDAENICFSIFHVQVVVRVVPLFDFVDDWDVSSIFDIVTGGRHGEGLDERLMSVARSLTLLFKMCQFGNHDDARWFGL